MTIFNVNDRIEVPNYVTFEYFRKICGMLFLSSFDKNAGSNKHTAICVLCDMFGDSWSYAFFVRGFGYALFYWGGETMNYDEWLENALSKISTLQIGSVFEVKDLFDSIEWNKQEPKDKRFFGKYFSCKYNDGVIKGIERVDYDKKISNKYRKTL